MTACTIIQPGNDVANVRTLAQQAAASLRALRDLAYRCEEAEPDDPIAVAIARTNAVLGMRELERALDQSGRDPEKLIRIRRLVAAGLIGADGLDVKALFVERAW